MIFLVYQITTLLIPIGYMACAAECVILLRDLIAAGFMVSSNRAYLLFCNMLLDLEKQSKSYIRSFEKNSNHFNFPRKLSMHNMKLTQLNASCSLLPLDHFQYL